jgi:hypothetical protein
VGPCEKVLELDKGDGNTFSHASTVFHKGSQRFTKVQNELSELCSLSWTCMNHREMMWGCSGPCVKRCRN